jgi:hypothetical protein
MATARAATPAQTAVHATNPQITAPSVAELPRIGPAFVGIDSILLPAVIGNRTSLALRSQGGRARDSGAMRETP